MNEYYQAGSTPAPNAPGSSAVIRAQFASIALAFDKLPVMAGSEGEFVIINESGTALVASGYVFANFVTVSGVQTVVNKTFAWADNTWEGFGTGATKNAGTGADEVLLLAESGKLPTINGHNVTNLNLEDAALTGEPTAPTPAVLDSSDRIATTKVVDQKLAIVNAAFPSDADPLMNGGADPGVDSEFSRSDHVHPTDTTRAPTANPTLTGKTTVDNSLGTLVSSHSLEVQQSGIAGDAGRAIFSQKLTYAFGISVANTGSSSAKADLQWLNRTTGLLVSTPLRLNYDGSVESGAGIKSNGNVEFVGSARRIIADLSNAIQGSRLLFQTSTDNSGSNIGVLPKGSGTLAGVDLFNASTLTDAGMARFYVESDRIGIAADRNGAGAYLPIIFYAGGGEKMHLKTDGDLLLSGTGAVKLQTGTTAQRPVTPVEGMLRRNSQLSQWEGYDGSQWGGIGGASGGGGNPFCYENDILVTVNYTITTGKNAMTAGPITIADGVTVTVPDGSVWSII